MKKELYFDIVSDEGAGGLYRITSPGSRVHFYYHYSITDIETDITSNHESDYPDFAGFWKTFSADRLWFCLHPLYLHPDQRAFVKKQLNAVNWNVVEDEKWREMYARQWNKVLNGPADYYAPKLTGG